MKDPLDAERGKREFIYFTLEPKEMKEDDFFVSLVADARGGVCYSKRLPGFKLIVPQNCLQEPTRIFAKAIRESKNTLRLMDGEVQASKILEFTEMKFNGNIAVGKNCRVSVIFKSSTPTSKMSSNHNLFWILEP